MQRRQFLAATLASAAGAAALSGCGGGIGPEHFTLIATEGPGLRYVGGPVIADDGTVAFSGESSTFEAVFFGDGVSPLSRLLPGRAVDGQIRALGIGSAGDIVFLERRHRDPIARIRHGHTREPGITTLLDAPVYTMHMSSNGTVAIYIDDADYRGFYRGPAAGPLSELQPMGDGNFWRGSSSRGGLYDVNDAGEVAAAISYSGLSVWEGVLILHKAHAPVSSLRATLQRVHTFPESVAINNRGEVAFSLNEAVVIEYFTPPFPTPSGSDGRTSAQLLLPGVYLATPAPIGTPVLFTEIAGAFAGYSNFGAVDVNDEGTVVFRAHVGRRAGIFRGRDPMLDLVAFDGEVLEIDGTPHVLAEPWMGQLNNRNQLALRTKDPRSDRYSIWRIDLPPR